MAKGLGGGPEGDAIGRARGATLSGRLLSVTIATVMVLEVLIFTPSVARFREALLMERLRMAELASLAILATPEGALAPGLEAELLARAGATSIALRRDGARGLVLNAQMPPPVAETYDLRDAAFVRLIVDAFRCLGPGADRHVRVIGRLDPASPDEVEITMDEAPVKAAVRAFGLRILALSLVISMVTAALIYWLVRRLLVRPMARLVGNMAAFREDPEDAARVIAPSSDIAELAEAERTLAAMQTELREALRSRARLAALGEAVAKISHDLRNMLGAAQLLADRLGASRDPAIARIGPKLLNSLNRAVALCESTLRYGAAKEAPPEPRRVMLARLVDEVFDAVFPDVETCSVRHDNRAPAELVVTADPDHLYRILSNLARNARQAIEATGRGGLVAVEARVAEGSVEIDVIDDGPGLPTKALENLFQPFRGGARREGAGLGLAIAQELARLQGGRVALVSSTTLGTVFRVTTPS
jgi:signal transduction histidine kinase